jgi:hypothetical protein
MVDDMLMRTVLMGGISGLDLITFLALLGIGAFYFFAPAAGYAPSRRGAILGAMWALIAKMALTLLRIGIALANLLDSQNFNFNIGGAKSGNPLWAGPVGLVIMLCESAVFLLAMILFVAGLASLRRTDEPRPIRRGSFGDD